MSAWMPLVELQIRGDLARRRAAVVMARSSGVSWGDAIERRRLFPGITDNALARECGRTIAGRKPLRPVKRLPKPARLHRVR
jgi:hypothetical protein